jgi:hypothetical protein
MIDVYLPAERESVIVTIPDGEEHAGTWHGEIRARLLDQDMQDWFFEIGYNTGVGENRIGTFPVEWVRRPELTDFDGIIPPDVLSKMKRRTTVVQMPQRDT